MMNHYGVGCADEIKIIVKRYLYYLLFILHHSFIKTPKESR